MATINIVDGPSKFDLMIALFHAPQNNRDEPLGFTLEDGRVLGVFLRGVEMEDGSHENWNLTGRLMSGDGSFKAWFSTKNRKGHTTLDD